MILQCFRISNVLKPPTEEIALPLKGKKRNLRKSDFIDYFALERLQLNMKTIDTILQTLHDGIPAWQKTLQMSFLSDELKQKYCELLEHRKTLLDL